MTHASIPPGRPKVTVTVEIESNQVRITARGGLDSATATLSIAECDALITELCRLVTEARLRQAMVEREFRQHAALCEAKEAPKQ